MDRDKPVSLLWLWKRFKKERVINCPKSWLNQELEISKAAIGFDNMEFTCHTDKKSFSWVIRTEAPFEWANE